MQENINKLAEAFKKADAIAIFAGAGMSADSGISTFRNDEKAGEICFTIKNRVVDYISLSTPTAFRDSPEKAWGLIGNEIALFDRTTPHDGYYALLEMLYGKDYFILTSNVDKQFEKAGFNKNRIFEIHGSVYKSQCLDYVECGVWSTSPIFLSEDNLEARFPFPTCPVCGSGARPNIFLFEDDNYNEEIGTEQHLNYMNWKERVSENYKNIIALEIGVGSIIASIKHFAERFANKDHQLFRINITPIKVSQANHIFIKGNALEILQSLKEKITEI